METTIGHPANFEHFGFERTVLELRRTTTDSAFNEQATLQKKIIKKPPTHKNII